MIVVKKTQRRSEWQRSWRRFQANRVAILGLIFIVVICLVAIFANVLAPHDPTFSFPGKRGAPPEAGHLFGFDHIGRDLFSRILYGARPALTVGLVSTFISVTIGVTVGAVAGYFGGWVDIVLSRIIDTLMAFPLLALLIVLAAVLGPSLTTTVTVIGLTTWARFARVVRADVLSVKRTDYITASRAVGLRDAGIIWRHVIPNILSPVIVLASLGIGSIIILESALSFLGLGIRPPNPSWGGTLADGRALIRQYPLITIFPGLMIFLTVLAFNFVGDGLRDALDPRERLD